MYDIIIKITAAAILFGIIAFVSEIGRATRDSENNIIDSGSLSAFSIQEGDCVQEPRDEEFESVQAVPCSEEHDYEVFGNFQLTLSAFDSDQIAEEADTRCELLFEDYVGINYYDSIYYITWFYPTQEAWNSGQRKVDCLIYSLDPMPLRSIKGSAT